MEEVEMEPAGNVPVIRVVPGSAERDLVMLRWGLVPADVDDPSDHEAPIHARAESIDETSAFRSAFLERRCIMPADGFPVWEENGDRRMIRHRDEDRTLAFAAVWERWEPRAEEAESGAIESCAMITVAANELVARFQDRMPAILEPDDFDVWLDPATDPTEANALLRPYPAGELRVTTEDG